MTPRVSPFSIRLPISLKAAIEKLAEADGTSMNQLVMAPAEKLTAIQTSESSFAARHGRGDLCRIERTVSNIRDRNSLTPPSKWQITDQHIGLSLIHVESPQAKRKATLGAERNRHPGNIPSGQSV